MHAPRPMLAALSIVGLTAAALAGCSHRPAPPEGLPCHAVAATGNYALDTDQSANAATIAAVGKRLGLPDHAVTIALAAALQESKLYNLPYGDLDSLGLFQQRPSQGWGTKDQILNPRYAAAAFYQHLATVANWTALSVTDAAQAVQHSGVPDAYAQWEGEARTLAQAFTGEVAAGFTCRTVTTVSTAPPATVLAADLTAEVGSPALGTPVDTARGWLVAGWLIAHAGQYGVTTVTFAGYRWSGQKGTWTAQPPATNLVQVNR